QDGVELKAAQPSESILDMLDPCVALDSACRVTGLLGQCRLEVVLHIGDVGTECLGNGGEVSVVACDALRSGLGRMACGQVESAGLCHESPRSGTCHGPSRPREEGSLAQTGGLAASPPPEITLGLRQRVKVVGGAVSWAVHATPWRIQMPRSITHEQRAHADRTPSGRASPAGGRGA